MPRVSNQLWDRIETCRRPLLIAGPCVIESEGLCQAVARGLRRICRQLDLEFVFKASYDKANRSSVRSFRGPGWEAGLGILERIRTKHEVPVLTDVHCVAEVESAANVVDVVQIPAFLCRQTDLLVAAGRTGKVINLKKGQFMAPEDMVHAVEKVASTGNRKVLVTERGTSFGYHNLVVDMRSLPILRRLGLPVIFDATHSVQLPGGAGDRSGGQREFAPVLGCAATAAGADGWFVETHPEPERARSDGPNMIPLAVMGRLLRRWLKVWQAAEASRS